MLHAAAVELQGQGRIMSQIPRVLIVEDQYLIAIGLRDELRRLGIETAAIVPSVAAALAALERDAGVHAALLDLNLAGERSYPVADALAARKIPYAFVTGYTDGAIDARYTHVPVVRKPVGFAEIKDTVTRLLSSPAIE